MPTWASAASTIIVSIAPIGVVPCLMSNAAGEPPHTIGAPGWASWWRITPERLSAACWTTISRSVTGDVAPPRGIETSSAGMPARAQSSRAWHVRSLHFSGGLGQQSKIASGLSARARVPPRTAASIAFMTSKASFWKVPVMTGFVELVSAT